VGDGVLAIFIQVRWSYLAMAVLCGLIALALGRSRRRLAEHFARISLVPVEAAVFEVVLGVVAVSAALLAVVAVVLLVVT